MVDIEDVTADLLNVLVVDQVQSLESLTDNVYVPVVRPVKIFDEPYVPPFIEYVYPPLPPEALTVIVPFSE